MTELDWELINELEQKLGLQFLQKNNSGNLCFVNNNEELQNEYKQSFTETDFDFFLNSFQNKNVEIPHDALSFWELVEKGKKKS